MTGNDFQDYIGGLTEIKGEDGTVTQKIANMKNFRRVKDKLKVLARSQPEHKYMLVTGLKELGAVVAVTRRQQRCAGPEQGRRGLLHGHCRH